MTRTELHNRLAELLYIEDFGMVDVLIASVIANSLKIGDPVWMTLIGPSSGGKSQIIRPFAKAHKLIHRVDDLTPNTFLSGMHGNENSLLKVIGPHGIISMDDLTVLFSKNTEARGEILSQFRMLYDGRYTKASGGAKGEQTWEGYMGMISGSTPSIYRYFGEVADMGERFISYRMKSYDSHKAVQFIMDHQHTAKDLDERIAHLLQEYLAPILQDPMIAQHAPLSVEVKAVISHISEHATLLRTPVSVDDRTMMVDEFPEREMPFRVMKQLTYLAMGLQMHNRGPLTPDLVQCLEWTGYSLANDKRRAYLRTCVGLHDEGKQITTRNLSSVVGLSEDIVARGMDQLQALHIVELADEESGRKRWSLTNIPLAQIVRRLDPPILLDSIDDI